MTKAREAIRWLNTKPNAPKHFTKAGNEVCRETIRKALEMLDKVESGTAYYGEWLPIESAPKETLIFIKAKGCDSGRLIYGVGSFEQDGFYFQDGGELSNAFSVIEWTPLSTFKESEEWWI